MSVHYHVLSIWGWGEHIIIIIIIIIINFIINFISQMKWNARISLSISILFVMYVCMHIHTHHDAKYYSFVRVLCRRLCRFDGEEGEREEDIIRTIEKREGYGVCFLPCSL